MTNSTCKVVTIPAPLSFRAAMAEERERQIHAQERLKRQERIRIRERNAARRQRNAQKARIATFKVVGTISLIMAMAAVSVGGFALTIMALKWLWYNWILL